MTLRNLLILPEPPFLLENGDVIYLTRLLWGLHEKVCLEHKVQSRHCGLLTLPLSKMEDPSVGEFRGLGSIQKEQPLPGSWVFPYPVSDIHVRVQWEHFSGTASLDSRWHMSVVGLQMVDFGILDKGSPFCF